jgi:hypothetical protein
MLESSILSFLTSSVSAGGVDFAFLGSLPFFSSSSGAITA